ncbi:MAG: SCO family protein [Flavobacteriales bacterium]
MKYVTITLISSVFLVACGGKKTETEKETETAKLPFIGQHDVDEHGDTIYHTIPGFELWNQDSVAFSHANLEGKIHVADFFFTSCETICPQMTSHMKKVAKHIANMDDVHILSFSVDPEHDTPSVLKQYGEVNGVDFKKWTFLTGEEEYIHELGGEAYLLNMMRDSSQQGGFLHSEFFVLVDKNGRVRGMYDGTNNDEVDRLLKEIDVLRKEKN